MVPATGEVPSTAGPFQIEHPVLGILHVFRSKVPAASVVEDNDRGSLKRQIAGVWDYQHRRISIRSLELLEQLRNIATDQHVRIHEDRDAIEAREPRHEEPRVGAVSYTHLTLPT